MIRIKHGIILSVLVCLLGFQARAHVALDNPVGGEMFMAGTYITISWHVEIEHETTSWELYFSSNAGANWVVIQEDIAVGQLELVWQVPNIATSQAQIRVVQVNQLFDYDDVSENFTIIRETDPPAVTLEATNLTLQCSSENQEAQIQEWLNNNGLASATSSCGALTWSNDYNGLGAACGMTGTTTVTFTVTDACDEMSTTSAELSVMDTEDPSIINQAQDIFVDCDDMNSPSLQVWLDDAGGAHSEDDCSAVTWTYEYFILPDGCNTEYGTTFLATDACGNSTETYAIYVSIDNNAPIINTEPQSIIVGCDDADKDEVIQSWLDNYGGAVATDACSEVMWSHDFTEPDSCELGIISVNFTASDACDNSTSVSANLELVLSTGFYAPFDDLDVNVFPNPTSDYLYIETDPKINGKTQIALYHISGKLVWSECDTQDSRALEVTNLASGLYLLHVRNDNSAKTIKVIIE